MRDEYIFTTEEQAKKFTENLEYLDPGSDGKIYRSSVMAMYALAVNADSSMPYWPIETTQNQTKSIIDYVTTDNDSFVVITKDLKTDMITYDMEILCQYDKDRHIYAKCMYDPKYTGFAGLNKPSMTNVLRNVLRKAANKDFSVLNGTLDVDIWIRIRHAKADNGIVYTFWTIPCAMVVGENRKHMIHFNAEYELLGYVKKDIPSGIMTILEPAQYGVYKDLLNLESISEEGYRLDFTCIKGDRTTI